MSATFFSGAFLSVITPSFSSSDATSAFSCSAAISSELPLHVERRRPHGGRVDVHRLAAAGEDGVRRRVGVGVVDWMLASGTPSSSATIIAIQVLVPVPMSEAPVVRLALPSAT